MPAIHDQYSYNFLLLFRQYHHHDIALLIDSTFKYVDVNPTDGLLEKSELARAFEDLDANSKLSNTCIYIIIRWSAF